MATLMIAAVFILLLAALVGIALRVASARGHLEKPTGGVGREQNHPPSETGPGGL